MLPPPSKRLWIVAVVVSALCVGGLVYAVITDWNTPVAPMPSATSTAPVPYSTSAAPPASAPSGGGFTSGLLLGLGAGVVLGSLLAVRARGVTPGSAQLQARVRSDV